MIRKLAVTGVLTAAMVLGLAVAPAQAVEDDDLGPGFTTAVGINCDAIMDDTSPRWFDEFTLEDQPPSPTKGGGRTYGYVWVDRRVDGQGYDVCVGWPGSGEPFPYMAIVKDNLPDAHGAIAYATFIPWGGTADDRVRVYGPRVDGYGNIKGYNYVATKVTLFYVGVCLIANKVKSKCNDERGSD